MTCESAEITSKPTAPIPLPPSSTAFFQYVLVPVRLAVLDDYQQVAASLADWKGLLPGIDVVFYTDHLKDEDALVARLAGFEAVFAMRERTAFPRRVIERLPELRLIV